MQPETRFKNKVKDCLEKIPRCWFVKTQFLAISGIPDYLGVVNGRFFALELKIETNKTDTLQGHILKKIARAGGFTAVVKPSNLKQVIKELGEL